MRALIRRHTISFQHAIDGIIWAIRSQPNFRIHLVISLLVIATGYYFAISSLEAIILVFVILLGLSAEMINTAIESVTDLVTKEYRVEAKIAKDVSAGMMLIVAIGASIIGLIIFLPYLFAYFGV